MAQDKIQLCIAACDNCALACDHCAVACLQEPQVASMTRCIRLDLDCANACRFAASSMARHSEFYRQVCQLCAEICQACGEECRQFDHDHCQRCAQACKECAEACRAMAA